MSHATIKIQPRTISVAVVEGPTRCHDTLVTGMLLPLDIQCAQANLPRIDWLEENSLRMRASYLTLSKCKQFDKIKYRAILAKKFLAEGGGEDDQVQVVRDILDKGSDASVLKKKRNIFTNIVDTIRQFTAVAADRAKVARAEADRMDELGFIAWLFDAKQIFPVLTLVEDAIDQVTLPWFTEQISKAAKDAARHLERLHRDYQLASIAAPYHQDACTLQSKFMKKVEDALAKDTARYLRYHTNDYTVFTSRLFHSDSAHIRLESVIMQHSGFPYGTFPTRSTLQT